jgi:hypothetical protein
MQVGLALLVGDGYSMVKERLNTLNVSRNQYVLWQELVNFMILSTLFGLKSIRQNRKYIDVFAPNVKSLR